MTDSKSWYESKTIWAGVTVLILAALRLMQIAVTPDLQDDITAWVELLGQVIAGAVTIFGRIAATKTIDPAGASGAKGGTLSSWILFCVLLSAICVSSIGCAASPASIEADQLRLTAVKPLVVEHVASHPTEAQTWDDFLVTWQAEIEAKKAGARGQGQGASGTTVGSGGGNSATP